jgi:hypothetical protein
MSSIIDLIKGLSPEDGALFSLLSESGWTVVPEDGEFVWRNYEASDARGPFETEAKVIAAAHVIQREINGQSPDEALEQPAQTTSGFSSIGDIANQIKAPHVSLSAAGQQHKELAHEVDLRSHFIEELTSKGVHFRTDVDSGEGIADLVAGDTLYEFKCTLTTDNLKGIVELAIAYRDALELGTLIVASCCVEDIEAFKAMGLGTGIEADAWEYSVNSDILQIINPSLKSVLSEAEKVEIIGAATLDEANPARSDSLFDLGADQPSRILVQQMTPDRLTTHPSLLMRAQGLDRDHAEGLVAGYKAGRTYPPADVFFDGETYWVADGNHRHAAALEAGALLDVEVHKGTLRDAILFALRANANHGLRLTNDDKRLKAVTLLADEEWFKESDSMLTGIAGGMTQPFLSDVRRSLTRLVPVLIEDPDGESSDEELAAVSGTQISLVRLVRNLTATARATLIQNVLADDGRRRGSDGIVRAVATKAAEPETPLFAGVELQPGHDALEVQISGVEVVTETIAPDGTSLPANEANPEPTTAAVAEQQEGTEGAPETGSQKSAPMEPEVSSQSESYFGVTMRNAGWVMRRHATVGMPAGFRADNDTLRVSRPPFKTSAEAIADAVEYQDEYEAGQKARETARSQAENQTPTQPEPTPIEELLGNEKLAISYIWIPGLEDKVSVTISIGNDPYSAFRTVVSADVLRPLPEEVMQLVKTQLEEAQAKKKTLAKATSNATAAAGSSPSTKKKPAARADKTITKTAAKKSAVKASKSSSKKSRAKV